MSEYKEMPQAFHDWLTALRSGEYEKGQGFLSNDGKYCVQGVACKAVGLEEHGSGISSFLGNTAVWPSQVCDKLGIERDANIVVAPLKNWPDRSELILAYGQVSSKRNKSSIVAFNDGTDASFEEIADRLEYTYCGTIRGEKVEEA